MEETYAIVWGGGSIGKLHLDEATRIQKVLLREFGIQTERFSENIVSIKPKPPLSNEDIELMKEHVNNVLGADGVSNEKK